LEDYFVAKQGQLRVAPESSVKDPSRAPSEQLSVGETSAGGYRSTEAREAAGNLAHCRVWRYALTRRSCDVSGPPKRQMNNVSSKAKMLAALRSLLQCALQMQGEGTPSLRLGRAQGCADGYMSALLDAGVADASELVALVAEERARLAGPAARCIECEREASVAA
jgi:hypothetical protein